MKEVKSLQHFKMFSETLKLIISDCQVRVYQLVPCSESFAACSVSIPHTCKMYRAPVRQI